MLFLLKSVPVNAPTNTIASSSSASSISGISGISTSNCDAFVPTGDAAAVTAAPSRAAAQDGNRGLDHAGNDTSPMPLSLSEHSAQAGSAAPGPAEEVDDTSNSHENESVDLPRACELEPTEAAGLLTSADELLAEGVVCEGLGQTSSEEDVMDALLGEVLSERFRETGTEEDNALEL